MNSNTMRGCFATDKCRKREIAKGLYSVGDEKEFLLMTLSFAYARLWKYVHLEI